MTEIETTIKIGTEKYLVPDLSIPLCEWTVDELPDPLETPHKKAPVPTWDELYPGDKM